MAGRRATSSVRGHGPFVAAALILLVFLFSGCDKKDAAQAPSGPKPFSLVVSADTAGWITPCGCTSNQSGGLPRRGTYLTTLRGSGHEVIYADAGGAAGGNSEYHQLKFEALLAGEMKMGLVAHNIGKTEASLGADVLRQAARKTGAPLISSNVRDAAGQLIAEPVKIVAAGGTRIAFVGVLSPSLASPQTKVDEPQAAILSAIAPVKGQYDSLIVLAYLPQQELEALAGSLPEADVVVGGPTGQSIAPRKIGRTLIAASTNKGKFLVRLNAEPAAGWGGEVVEMAPALADDAAQQVVLATFLEGLEKRDLPASQTGLVPPVPAGAPADYRIAGSQSCLSCHTMEKDIWAHSKHNHAWDTIKAKNFHVDSACQQCHTTGFGLPGGFESRAKSATLVSVGCESCHGPSQSHVLAPTRSRTPYIATDQCVRCHDHENSPTFDYALYWPHTRHGKGSQPDPATQPSAPNASVSTGTLVPHATEGR